MIKKNKSRVKDVALDEYEQEIESQFEKAKRLPLAEEKKMILMAQQAAAHHNRKKREERINIRVFANDLVRIKKIADEEGLAYQTLITSVLHKFAAGRLKDSHNVR